MGGLSSGAQYDHLLNRPGRGLGDDGCAIQRATACIFGMWSLPLYKDNPVYRVSQAVFVGSCAGHAIGVAIGNIKNYGLVPLFGGKVDLIVPVALGLLLYTRFFPAV